MIGPLCDSVKVVRVMTPQTASTSDTLKATIVDMAGYDGVMFICALGDVTVSAVATLKAAIDDVNNTSGMGALTGAGATITATATSADDKLLIIDVQQPAQRYVEAQLTRATANIEVDDMIALLYKGNKPTTHDSGVVSEFIYPPRTALA